MIWRSDEGALSDSIEMVKVERVMNAGSEIALARAYSPHAKISTNVGDRMHALQLRSSFTFREPRLLALSATIGLHCVL